MEQKSNGFAIAAMVLGIVGAVLGFFPVLGWFLLPAWILAIIFGIIGIKKGQSKGMSWTGIICGALMFLWQMGFLILVAIGAASSSP